MTALPSVQIDQLPQSVEDFLTLQEQIAGTPQGGAAMMVVALLLYADDVTLGHACLTLAVDQDRLSEGDKGYGGWQLRGRQRQLIRTQIGSQPHIPRSYFEGTCPENGYQLPPSPYELSFSDNPYSGDIEAGTYKVFVGCSGAASPRPVMTRRGASGLWKACEWSSLLVGVRKPEPPAVDF
jgi:hypothetical protein